MRLLLVDNCLLIKKNGKYFSPSIYDNSFFKRYVDVFGNVRFLTKVIEDKNSITELYNEVNLKGLEIHELPYYRGLSGMVKVFFPLLFSYYKATHKCDCYIFRIAQIESYFSYIFSSKKKPYAVEVVNDPSQWIDIKGIFRFFNIFFFKRMILKANGVSYVTKYTLQNKYPCKALKYGESDVSFAGSYSSVDLFQEDILTPKIFPRKIKKLSLIHVANSINGNTKGHITAINSVNLLNQKGHDVSVTFVGDGPSVLEFKNYSKKIGIEDKVFFVGKINNRKELIKYISKYDLFVLPSYTEGLPRSIIEALAAGLPCLASLVGGNEELLNKRYLFQPDDVVGYVDMITKLITVPLELEKMSRENIQKAKEFLTIHLNNRRRLFYCRLKSISGSPKGIRINLQHESFKNETLLKNLP